MASEPLISSEPAEALARAQQLLREGKSHEARPWLQAACTDAQALPAEQAAATWCLLGLQQREQGEEGPAGHSFLRALQYQGDCEQALWALDFHRYTPELLAELLPGLDALVSQGQCHHPRALQVLADWHHQVGDRPMAERFFRALAGDRGGSPGGGPGGSPGGSPAGERRPEALVIGAPKCGTTSLMAYLGAHPQVWTQPRKECLLYTPDAADEYSGVDLSVPRLYNIKKSIYSCNMMNTSHLNRTYKERSDIVYHLI